MRDAPEHISTARVFGMRIPGRALSGVFASAPEGGMDATERIVHKCDAR